MSSVLGLFQKTYKTSMYSSRMRTDSISGCLGKCTSPVHTPYPHNPHPNPQYPHVLQRIPLKSSLSLVDLYFNIAVKKETTERIFEAKHSFYVSETSNCFILKVNKDRISCDLLETLHQKESSYEVKR